MTTHKGCVTIGYVDRCNDPTCECNTHHAPATRLHLGVLALGAGRCNNSECWCHLAQPIVKEHVNHPSHYGGDTVYEVINVLEAWLSPAEFVGFLKGNVHKYLARAAKKGNAVVDAEKAAWYGAYLSDYMKRTGGPK